MTATKSPSPIHIYLFHGKNSFLINQKISFWKEEFIKKYDGDININVIDVDNQTKLSSIISEAETMPFLSKKRLIIVKNLLTAAKKDLENFLEKIDLIPESSIIVFAEFNQLEARSVFLKKIQKIGKVESFDILKGSTLEKWIAKEIQAQGSTADSATIKYLAEISGADLWKLSAEIQKLKNYTFDRPIGKKDIDLLTDKNIEVSIFKLTDLIGQKNLSQALNILKSLNENNQDPVFIFHMIIRQFRLLIQIRSLLDQKNDQKTIIFKLKLKPFIANSLIRQAANFTLEQLKTIYRRLLDIEVGLKTGKIRHSTSDTREFILALEKLIIESAMAK